MAGNGAWNFKKYVKRNDGPQIVKRFIVLFWFLHDMMLRSKGQFIYRLRQFAQLNNNAESGIIIFIQDTLSLGEARNGA